MKQNKTTQLIKGLSEKEVFRLGCLLDEAGKHRLVVLLNYLAKAISAAAQFTDQELYKEVFNEPYQKADNFKLRNELRLLNISIADFMVEERQKQVIKLKPSAYTIDYLQGLSTRGLHDLFEKESNKAIQQFTQSGDLDGLEKLTLQRLEHDFAKMALNEDSFEDRLKDLDRLSNTINNNQLIKESRINYFKAYSQRVLFGLGQKDMPMPVPHPLTHKGEELPKAALFYTLRANTYLCSGDEKLAISMQLLTLCDEVNYPGLNPEKERFTILGSIALEYFLTKNFEKALVYSQQAYQQLSTVEPILAAKFLNNHCSLLMRMGKFAESLALIELHWGLIEPTIVKPRMVILQAVCHVFTANPSAALELLPEGIGSYAQYDRNYIRLLEAMALVDMGNFEIALYRVNAAIKNLGTNKNFDEALKVFAQLFKRYIQMEQGIKDEAYKQKIDTTRKQLAQWSLDDNVVFGGDNFMVMWLLRKTGN